MTRTRTESESPRPDPPACVVRTASRWLAVLALLLLAACASPVSTATPGPPSHIASPTAPLPSPSPSPSPTPTPTPEPLPTPLPTPLPPRLSFLADFYRNPPVFVDTDAKLAYLTFDDGPSERTIEILEVLDRYDIKAAFFVMNRGGDRPKEILREVVRRGHVVGMHTATHDYAVIYASVEVYVRDLHKNYRFILEATGIPPGFFRFPGGSNQSTAGIRAEMAKRRFFWYDWNCSSGDGNSANTDPDKLVANVLRTAKGQRRLIVLAHDSSGHYATVAALPGIIEGLRAQGYEFAQLTDTVRPIAFRAP